MRISDKDIINSANTFSWPKKDAETNSDQEQVTVSDIPGNNVNGVNVSISTEGLSMYQEQLEATKESDDGFEDQAKMMEIARRISSGGKVPPQDERKLMEYSAELYQMAKEAALMNENKEHKNYDTLFEEDSDEMDNKLSDLDTDSSASGAAESAPVDITQSGSVDNEGC